MKMVKIDIDEFGILCICAERYALGRRSYIVSEVCRIIKAKLEKLTERDIKTLIKDIENPYGGYGDKCDETNWKMLIRYLKAELERKGENEN